MKPRVINGIGLENFRVFKDHSYFELAPITILTGANSSGKSSVIKALNLMQGFYKDKDSLLLDFKDSESSYHHQLGNFEMVVNREKKNKKEFTISYTIPCKYWDPGIYNYWGNLLIENTFCTDNDSKLKNGKLKASSIYMEDNGEKILISQIFNDNDIYWRFFDIPVVIRKFISLHKECLDYVNKINEYIVKIDVENFNTMPTDGDIITIKDYTGPVICKKNDIDNLMYYPELNQQFSDFMGFDHTKLQIFTNDTNTISRLLPFRFFIPIDINVSCMDSPKIMELIKQIPIEDYDKFEQHLWDLIIKKDTSLKYRHTFESFLKLFDEVDKNVLNYQYELERDYLSPKIKFPLDNRTASIQAIKDFIKKNASTDFDSFYKKQVEEIHKETSLYVYNKKGIFSQIMEDIETSPKIHPQTDNLMSILKYFCMFEFYLNMEIVNLQESFIIPEIDGDDWTTTIKRSNLYSFIEKKEKELDELVYGQIHLFYNKCDFVESVRANTQRLYTFTSQGTSFNQFLAKFLDKKYPAEFINKWIKEFEIGDGIEYTLLAGVGTELNIVRGNGKINIVDLGYGVTQFVALLLRIVYAGHEGYTTIVIEEPETNLHPKLQSKLADLFFDACKTFGIQFIIEAHSEYLIRKLQYLTATGEIKPEETVIHYIGNPDVSKHEPEEEQVRTIHIKPNGQLTKPFGSGFTDESSHWIKEMFTLSNQN